jgi:FKBP-type peptidyl-prolyl cis-trans isomerase FkpA
MHILRPAPRITLSIIGLALLAGCSNEPVGLKPLPLTTLEAQTWGTSLNINLASMTKLPSGVYIKDDVVGTGATVGATATVHAYYAGYLASGTKFDEAARPAASAMFALGNVIDGFRLGVEGMKVGGKRRILIHSTLGYGASGLGPIPGNANLVFDVEIVSMP